jgi:hypothetical protein
MTFMFRLEDEDGAPADAPTFRTGKYRPGNPGDTIPLGGRTLRVIGTRFDGGSDGDPLSVRAEDG